MKPPVDGARRSARWALPVAMAVVGSAVFVASLARGLGLAMIWLPAVLIASAWPGADGRRPGCLRRLRRAAVGASDNTSSNKAR